MIGNEQKSTDLVLRSRLCWLLRLVAVSAFLAFLAAVMPSKLIVVTSELLGFDPFPRSPLTFYLARHLSLMYGFVGILFWEVSCDLDRYHKLLRVLAFCTVALGCLQAVIDAMSGLPAWWTLAESISTIAGGLILVRMSGRVHVESPN